MTGDFSLPRDRTAAYERGHSSAPRGAGGLEAESLADRYRILQKAGGLVAPLLTVLLAFFISGIVVLLTTGSVGDTIETYKAIFRGSGLSWFVEFGSHDIGVPFSDARVWFPWNTDDDFAPSPQRTSSRP